MAEPGECIMGGEDGHELFEAHETRLTTVEQNLQNLAGTVNQLVEDTKEWRREDRESQRERDKQLDRQFERLGEKISAKTEQVHERVDKQIEKKEWNPTLLIAAVVAAIAIGGVFVSFVNTVTGHLRVIQESHYTQFDHHIKQGGHAEALTMHAEHQAKIADLHLETEKLHSITDRLIWQSIEDAEKRGYKAALLDSMKSQQDRRWQEIITGAESRGALKATIEHLKGEHGSEQP